MEVYDAEGDGRGFREGRDLDHGEDPLHGREAKSIALVLDAKGDYRQSGTVESIVHQTTSLSGILREIM